MEGFRIGIDVGGTFTDFIVVDDSGGVRIYKEATTPQDPSEAVIQGLKNIAESHGLEFRDFLERCELIVHGTTIATNMVIQRSGPKAGLVTTVGHRDVLYFRDGYKPRRFDLKLKHPEPLIPRYLRLPVRERLDYQGEVVLPLDEGNVKTVAKKFREEEVNAVAVALLWSMKNPEHEKRVRDILRKELGDIDILLSSEVLPMVREWERTCATVLSAYVHSATKRYMMNLEEYLSSNGYRHRLLIMQCNGGCATIPETLRQPVNLLLSGPAAGPSAGIFYAKLNDMQNIITMDMGGTSFDVCLINGNEPGVSKELRVEDMPIGVVALDIHSIGAGGGSVAWIDAGGALQVGPRSAGAVPGPACYGQGGEEPTVADANVVLGYLNPNYFLGGRRKLRRDLAEITITDKVAEPLKVDLAHAAKGIFDVVNHNMVNAIKVISIQRGVDPRDYTLVVGGGAGAIHAGILAEELGIQRAFIPKNAAAFCAFGMVCSDIKHDSIRTYITTDSELDIGILNRLFDEMEAEALTRMNDEGLGADKVEMRRFVDAKYIGQLHEIMVPVPKGVLKKEDVSRINDSFHDQHERLYTYSLRNMGVEYYHWRVEARGPLRGAVLNEQEFVGEVPSQAIKDSREVYFPKEGGFADVAIYDGEKLRHGMSMEGPAVVEIPTTTIVVHPGHHLEVNKFGDYTVEISGN